MGHWACWQVLVSPCIFVALCGSGCQPPRAVQETSLYIICSTHSQLALPTYTFGGLRSEGATLLGQPGEEFVSAVTSILRALA
mmetsp:Transcript_23033/g.74349  ORF Transcript_23033/g.74349 Transcript_23033/m.74349 type:complete len:83 (-) Transcript_23033:20-268(-)